MATKKKKEEVQEVAVVEQKKELVLEGDPEQQLAFAQKAASALMNWVSQKPKKVMIRGEQYLEFGDWQILARFYGATVGIEWTKKLDEPLKGYEARATVLRNGEVISSAEAMCTRDESNWKSRDEFMLKSMAQTRASAKALRQAFGWVAELAGMKSTPAEEMGAVYDTSPVPQKAVPVVHTIDHEEKEVQLPLASPESVSATINKQRMQIKDLLESRADKLLVTKEDYQKACLGLTGLQLEEWHYKEIIERLESIPT